MGDPKTVLEGSVKYRDKKKWKSRWAVVSKLSPVADCLHIQLYRDSKERCKHGPTKASLSLEDFLALEAGFTLDRESNTLALVCAQLVVLLAFDSRELLIQWQVKIRASLVEEQQFLVQIAHVPSKSKIPCGPARLHLQDHTFCLVSGVPPRLLGTWPIKELRRFGVVEGKFCFEGGSLCGKGEGLHVLLTNQLDELTQAMDLASKGKLLGKRKPLTRKNSVLESCSRAPLHKRPSGKVTSGDSSSRPLLSSGSECSTCDACSDILGCSDDLVYLSAANSSLSKASSCRIHYRWPSCFSRWGQSSTTTTTSDAESMDTVSVTLSDFQGPSHSTISKSNGHGQSLSCLCDSQGTWPFKQCTKCGRQFYSRNSMQSNQSCDSHSACKVRSPEDFSPQWTMDSLMGSSNEALGAKKDPLKPPSDRVSLCSHVSHSSNGSTASSSGSEYSVPKSFADSLYDRPKSVHHALNGTSQRNGSLNGTSKTHNHTTENSAPAQNAVCSCREPSSDWSSAHPLTSSQENLIGSHECTCWNKLAVSVRSEVDIRVTNSSCKKNSSANPSPNSSPKKTPKFSTGTARSASAASCDLPCTCARSDPYANYSVPRSTLVSMKDKQAIFAKANGKDSKVQLPSAPSEDYDVPKKFTDMLSNCDMAQKSSSMKNFGNGASCSCMSACRIVQNVELIKMASKHSFNPHSSSCETMQMCACQRVMLWAGSLVPCLGPQRSPIDLSGWQCGKGQQDKPCSPSWYNPSMTVCSKPPKMAEVMMVNGKPKHVLHSGSSLNSHNSKSHFMRPRSNTVSCPVTSSCQNSDPSVNYANIEFPDTENGKGAKVVGEDSASLNYANIEFAETLPLYENSNLVLSRLEQSSNDDTEVAVAEKPPLPPRTHQSSNNKSVNGESEKSEKCTCKHQCIHKSPKRNITKDEMSGSAYELMCFQKQYAGNAEDYLMMQPLFQKEQEALSMKSTDDTNSEIAEVSNATKGEESEPSLPLRPFMPYSYPGPKSNGNHVQENGGFNDTISRKQQLISEDAQLRSIRSNSLSELKKKVLTRKRSCSIDGKNKHDSLDGSIINSGVVSTPASPVSSPRPSVQRKNSLFSKLNLRSKEKSMSTNEIAPLAHVESSNITIGFLKSGLHRSADCLKLNEDYANSDEDLNSDNSDFTVQKESPGHAMKRSSSVPCRAAMPSITSPLRTTDTIMEMNDLNREKSLPEEELSVNVSDEKEVVQRKYSLDSHDRSKMKVMHEEKSNCDNVCRLKSAGESDAVLEMQAVLRRNHHHQDTCRSATSSCSSSDISDYMESLSFISRSSSSSSGSTCSTDYIRPEDVCLLRPAGCKPPLKGHHSSVLPTLHQSRPIEVNGDVRRTMSHPMAAADDSSSSSASGTDMESGVTHRVAYFEGHVNGMDARRRTVNSRGGKADEPPIVPCNGSCHNSRHVEHQVKIHDSCHTRDSTSSTSSLSSSPSVTDYSSSTSSSPPGQNNLVVTSLHISDKYKRNVSANGCLSESETTNTAQHQTDV